ncbi:MAG TPA: bifunctional DNA-binding transcriptional regulator/O6-methylguanine-DNA methyltransferase Ada [Gemmatimonadales bacterium]|nr:bifunctional DNA-binding transcriptional regulator/O6-methylguanine-DNA methyltransferase Ada [Gemmatimonadales bacterium]
MIMSVNGTHHDSDTRWAAVLKRDRGEDGRFVYAVRTTGVYCRPSCPSRRPHRRHVQFFERPSQAERAGFRPCKRCAPAQAEAADPGSRLAADVARLLQDRSGGVVSLEELSRATGRSVRHIRRVFKRVTGVSPRQFATARRVRTLKQRLRDTDTVTRAQFDAGFGSSSRLYERAEAALGMTPATYRKGGEGARIGYAIVPTSLGKLLVAGTERGLCAVRFGESNASLAQSLREEFPRAVLEADPPMVSLWAASLKAQTDGLKPSALLPLDVQATAFQLRVWEELRRIPFGETRTYADVARAIGRPRAARAVARACATNQAALAIPCHRVVRGDGSLGGYRWGVEKKRELLKRERGSA